MTITDGIIAMTYGNVATGTLVITHLNNLPLHHRIDPVSYTHLAKISGTFRSDKGSDAFMAVHSIADTAWKNKQSPFEAILALY